MTKAGFDYYHRVFGVDYPFGEYHQAFVPDFNAGAMENPGCVTLRDQFIYRSRATAAERASRAGVVAHEMAHMWFGDLVTMAWWDDLWLNESFAEYMAHRCCTEATRYELWTEFGILRKDWGSVADQAPSTHPVAGNGAADAISALADFDGISYAKGAAVLKQLAAHLGDEVFFAGLRDHFEAHAYGNATFADLIAAWTRAGAVNLEAWADAWLRTAGLDTLSVAGGQIVRSSRSDTPRPHAVQVASFGADGAELARTKITMTEAAVSVDVPSAAAIVVPDAADETWAKIRFGAASWTRVVETAKEIAIAPTRVVVANALRDAVRDGELDPHEALTGLLDLAASERKEIVVGSLLSFAIDQLCGPYLTPPQRAAALSRVRGAAAELLAAADRGSDSQLAVFRLAVRSSTDAGELHAWLDRRDLPPDLELDTELAWSIVDRLAILTGEAGVIDEQLASDPSAAGRAHAARARAGRADPAAKESAWRLIMQPSGLGAYELYATASGFFQPSQSGLCEPYAYRYFDEIGATAGFRSGWALGRLALHAYPAPHSEPAVVARAEACLDKTELAAPLRRSIVDGTDKLRRAWASRSRFGPAPASKNATDTAPTC